MDLSFRLVRACAFAERVASLFLSNHTNWTLGNSPEPAETNSLRNLWETGYSCLQANHPEVHEARSHTPARRTEAGNLFA